jgi:hypothetical protein
MATKKECSIIREYFAGILADHRKFKALYPTAKKREQTEDVKTCRREALALGDDLTERLENGPIREWEMKDIKIKIKIRSIIEGIIEDSEKTNEEPVRRDWWQLDFFVKNGIVHFRGLGDFRENTLRRAASEVLADEETPVEMLDLSKEKIIEADFDWLIEALENESNKVRVLRMSGNPLGNPGAFALAEVLKNENCKINNLQLDECELEKEGIMDIIDRLSSENSKLRVLNLAQNGDLEDEVVSRLGRVLFSKQCKLKVLDLSSNTFDLFPLIDLLPKWRSLTELNLSNTQFDDDAAQHFGEAYINNEGTLKKLILSNNPGLSLQGKQLILDAINWEGSSLEVAF